MGSTPQLLLTWKICTKNSTFYTFFIIYGHNQECQLSRKTGAVLDLFQRATGSDMGTDTLCATIGVRKFVHVKSVSLGVAFQPYYFEKSIIISQSELCLS